MSKNQNILFNHFPSNVSYIPADKCNPTIRLYGRRFYKDQTSIEYLAEFLLVFASPKSAKKNGAFSLKLDIDDDLPCYWPEDRVALKLFAFFPSSKLETRHSAHLEAYQHALNDIKAGFSGFNENDKDEVIRLLQSLFAGFIGVAKTRTWVTYSFLPASTSLLAREVTWKNPEALKAEVTSWEASIKHFDSSTHNFYGRGGELLFLQLANLFSKQELPEIDQETYKHLSVFQLQDLRSQIETELQKILDETIKPLEGLVDFIEFRLENYKLIPQEKKTELGWVSTSTYLEALLFAAELNNLCGSNLGSLEKLELLQLLCVMQVLRSLCFQARRIDEHENSTEGFMGNYAWIIANPEAKTEVPMRKVAQRSLERIEGLLYRALRSPRLAENDQTPSARDLRNGDDNCFRHFRKFAKEIGLIVPPKGHGQRFVLPPSILRFLVAALLEPGERIRLTEFYARVFAHYGIPLGERQLAVAMAWNSAGSQSGAKDYAVAADTAWIEEALQQGGFLVELSDAVSMVHNPGDKE